jgi:chorismate synthase
MSANTFGNHLKLTSFGESHGVAMGGVIDGFPAGISIDLTYVVAELARRRPGQAAFSSPRKEADEIEILSGVFEGRSLGTPIAFIIRNKDQRSGDYDHLRELYRTGHADRVYEQKYGHRDHRGGGRASARETVVRVAASALIAQILPDLRVIAYVSSIGPVSCLLEEAPMKGIVEGNPLRMAELRSAEEAKAYLSKLQTAGDSSGGTIHCFLESVPPGLGEPVYHKLQADLASAMMGINAVKGFELGAGSASASMPTIVEGSMVVSLRVRQFILRFISNPFRALFDPIKCAIKKEKKLNCLSVAVMMFVWCPEQCPLSKPWHAG